MIRQATVVIFKRGVSKEEAAAALAEIAHLIDMSGYVPAERETRELTPLEKVESYDDKWGDPVFYIP